jgi:hypothetical protein
MVDVDGRHDAGTDELNHDRFRHAGAARFAMRIVRWAAAQI